VQTGKEVTTLAGHEGPVTSVSFNSTGNLILTTAKDQTARVWDARTGEEVVTLRPPGQQIRLAAFSAGDAKVLTVSGEAFPNETSPKSVARLWPMDPLAVAVKRKPRDLTAEERKKFLIEDPESK